MDNNVNNFEVKRQKNTKHLKNMYSDEISSANRTDPYGYGVRYTTDTRSRIFKLASSKDVRDFVIDSLRDPNDIRRASEQLYATNPIYASVISYYTNMYKWAYKVTPHKSFVHSKAAQSKATNKSTFTLIYNTMLEAADGIHPETKFPALLTHLYVDGAVYFMATADPRTYSITTTLLPVRYCRKIGETQYGTAIIEFDASYFSHGFTKDQLNTVFSSFPDSFKKGWQAYCRDRKKRWFELDPRFASCLQLNDYTIPTLFYLYGSLLNYEQYQDNELELSDEQLRYLVVQTIPHYNDKLIFEEDEVTELHKSMRKIVDRGDKARLLTTYGDIHVEQISDSGKTENETLAKAYKSIFNSDGLNDNIFTGDSVEALKAALTRDKGEVWNKVQQLVSFYNLALNNLYDFKGYQADFEILPVSAYTYNDDIQRYKDNATLGVGKLDFMIAAGIKQKDISDQLKLEEFLGLNDIQPMQTTFTQTAEDRSASDSSTSADKKLTDETEQQTSSSSTSLSQRSTTKKSSTSSSSASSSSSVKS